MSQENPILRTPYEEPTTHYKLDENGHSTNILNKGRRYSGETEKTILELEPHKTINELRSIINEWRSKGYPGIKSRTRKLLEYWKNSDPGIGMKPFWCQMEVIETIIWLFEVKSDSDKILEKLNLNNKTYNDEIKRIAFKMATGTGKTNVMAMMMLWMLVNDIATNFLIITPNLTVKERLQVLVPKIDKNLWKAITPREFHKNINKANVIIVNFHVFQKRQQKIAGKSPGSKEKKILGEEAMKNYEETNKDMINRVLHDFEKNSKIMVINDEAHHCYQPFDMDKEFDDDQEIAAIWFNALKILKEQNRLEQVFDFSATPMWLMKPNNNISEIFPWTITDFSLLDAIESGLVKIPRVPVLDDTESHEPKYRNIYDYNDGKSLTGNLSVRVREPLYQLYKHYEEKINPEYEKIGITPVFIIVVNDIKNAQSLYRWIAGNKNYGNLDMFSNYEKNGKRKKNPPTLLVHSELFGKGLPKREQEMIKEQAILFGLKGSITYKEEKIRELFMGVGHPDSKDIRCVISVGMLTEGWDAKNVTHVFGYRKFGSVLLAEQVTGRALRRTSFVGSGKQKPEYANIFGVPYTFARGGDVSVQAPVQPYDVFSISGRDKFRIEFPNVIGYENSKEIRRFRLDNKKVKPYTVKTDEPKETKIEGHAGADDTTKRERRAKSAIWETAHKVATLLNHDNDRLISFIDSCEIVKEWLKHKNVICEDIAGMITDDNVPDRIVEACESTNEKIKIKPIFDDEKIRTTEGVDFQTTLKYVYPDTKNETIDESNLITTKSELNRAACHTYSETEIAKILDEQPKIESWVRNFKLDFNIPWFDVSQDAWRHMVPDFIAKTKNKNLIIEFKGKYKEEAEEKHKKHYLENWWCPSVSECEEYGTWESVWIEDLKSAKQQISKVCK